MDSDWDCVSASHKKRKTCRLKNPRSPAAVGFPAICHEKKHQPNSGLPSMAGAWPAKQNAKNGGIKIMNTPRNACLKTLFAYKCCKQGSSKLSQTKSHIFVPLQHPNSKKNSWWKSHASNCICRPVNFMQFVGLQIWKLCFQSRSLCCSLRKDHSV